MRPYVLKTALKKKLPRKDIFLVIKEYFLVYCFLKIYLYLYNFTPKLQERRRENLASTRKNGPTCLKFVGIPVGVWKLSELWRESAVCRVSERCLEAVCRVFSGCLEGIYGAYKRCLGCLNASKGQVRTRQVSTGQVKPVQVQSGKVQLCQVN